MPDDDEPRVRGGRLRKTRRAPTPAQDEGARVEGAHSPAAMWGNPRAAPDARSPPEPGRAMARERRDEEED